MVSVTARDGGRIPFGDFHDREFMFMGGVPLDGYELSSDYVLDDTFETDDVQTPAGSRLRMRTPGADERKFGPPWLIPRGDIGLKTTPVNKPTLHRAFAGLRTDLDYLGFANTWGGLGISVTLHAETLPAPLVLGESIRTWSDESAQMRALLEIWDMIRERRVGELKNLVTWHDATIGIEYVLVEDNEEFRVVPATAWDERGGRRLKDPGPNGELFRLGQYSLVAERERDREIVGHWSEGDPVGPAMYFVAKEVNKRLRGSVSPQLLPFRDEWYFVVASLKHLMWLQFMREMAGSLRVSRCEACGKWMSGGTKRRKYCDDRCRQAGFRSSKAKRA